jgi:hypothetical protein
MMEATDAEVLSSTKLPQLCDQFDLNQLRWQRQRQPIELRSLRCVTSFLST